MTELLETSMSLLKKPIKNKTNTKLETRMNDLNLGSNIVLRYEEVEQSNEQIKMQFKIKEFITDDNLLYKIYRNRSMGDYVSVYTSKYYKNNPNGVQFKEIEFPLKTIVRNDRERSIRFEVWKRSVKYKTETILGEGEFSIANINRMPDGRPKEFVCLHKKQLAGKVEVVKMEEWHKYQFIDYILGGMTVSLFLAIDFSLGNKHYKDPYSLHYIDEQYHNVESSDSE